MRTITVSIGNHSYEIATTLRVAYEIQGMNNHKSYLDVFRDLDKMTIENQIDFIYAGYKVAVPSSEPLMDKVSFRNLCLDNLDLMEMMSIIKELIEGITGNKVDSNTENAVEEKN